MSATISVILAASGGFPAVERTVRCLARQSIANQFELVLVGFGGPLDIPKDFSARFATCRLIQLPAAVPVATANAEGVLASSCPIVVFSEDHCFPDPGWAEALLKAHEQPYAAVGPAFRNANPDSATSWCDFLIGYGPWAHPCPSGKRPFLPGHNSSYKREELLHYADRLAEMLGSETVLHYELTSRGRELFLESSATVAHLNFSIRSLWFPIQYHCGRVFGGFRSLHWNWAKRICFAAAWPLIGLVRFTRVLPQIPLSNIPPLVLLETIPMLALGLLCDAFGQCVGYLSGPGDSPETLIRYEFNRVNFVLESDKRKLPSFVPSDTTV